MSDTPCKECLEQARLLGMSAERECALLAKIDRLERQRDSERELATVTEQRDRLAEAIKRYIAEDYTLVALQRTLAAVEGGSDE